MIDDPALLWRSQPADTHLPSVAELQARARAFDRKIVWRDRIEYAASLLVIIVFAWVAVLIPEPSFRIAIAAIVIGVGISCFNLRRHHKRNAANAPDPSRDCIAYLRYGMERQRDMLRSVGRWYIGPLLPGTALFFAVIFFEMSKLIGPLAAFAGMILPLFISCAIFAGVWWVNRRAARKLDEKIAALCQTTSQD